MPRFDAGLLQAAPRCPAFVMTPAAFLVRFKDQRVRGIIVGPLQAAAPDRRGTEVVVTGAPRKRVVG